MQKIVKLMEDPDPRVALAAAIHVLDRAWGKPEQKADVEMVHRFAQVPAVMSKADWLATRGDPRLLELKPVEAEKPKDPNSKLN
jgi:5-hydroxyisourate hydrolase-like protein (transthyretin family)